MRNNNSIGSFNGLSQIQLRIQISLLCLITVLSIIGNLFNLYFIFRTPSLRVLNSSILINLSIVDFLTGAVAIPCLIITSLYQKDDSLCQVQGFISTFLNGISLVMSAAISIERCTAVTDPYTYLAHLQTPRYTIIIISVWLIPIPFAILPLLHLQSYGLGEYRQHGLCWVSLSSEASNYIAVGALAAGVNAVIIIIVSCYTIIFYIAYNKSNSNVIIMRYRNIKRSVRTTFLIVGTNVICWFPLAVTCCLSTIHYITKHTKYPISNRLEVAILILSYSNVAINPIIYALTNSVLRKNYKILLNKLIHYITTGHISSNSTASVRPSGR